MRSSCSGRDAGHGLDARPARCFHTFVRRPLLGLLVALALTTPGVASAQSVTLTPGPGTAALARSLGLGVDALQDRVRQEVEALYGLYDVAEYLRLSANAQSLVGAGLGADYASNPTGFFVGVSASAAVSVAETDLQSVELELDREMPSSGGTMLSLLVGHNFREQGASWLTLSAHGLYLPTTSVAQLDGEFVNVGLRVQAKLLRPQLVPGFRVARWGGLDLTTGYTFARTTLTLGEEFEASAPLDGGVVLDTVSTGTLELVQTAHTIPVELTTNLTLFELLTVYGGAAVDIPLGDASATFDLDSVLTGVGEGQRFGLGTARLQVDDAIGADDVLPRFLAGVQVNLWALKVFSQLNIGTTDATLGLSAGVKLTF